MIEPWTYQFLGEQRLLVPQRHEEREAGTAQEI
jgi:hypothetical protein